MNLENFEVQSAEMNFCVTPQAPAPVHNYLIAVNYRTASGRNTRNVYVDASSSDEAFALASEKVASGAA